MGVLPIEHPKGSGKWWVRVNWKDWRKSKLVGQGEEAKEAAIQLAKYLNDAYMKFGTKAIELIEPPKLERKPSAPAFKEYAQKFLRLVRARGAKRSTYAMYDSAIRIHLESALGESPLDAIDYGRVRDLLAEKAQATYQRGQHGKPRRYSKDTIRVIAMTLRAIMAEAVREKMVAANPVAGVATFYKKRKKDRVVKRSGVFTLEELHKLEAVFAGRFPEAYELVLAMSREGMRIGEAVALEVHDVDFKRGRILVNKNVPCGIGQLEDSAKTEASDREIELSSAEFRRALEAMLARRKAAYFAARKKLPKLMFCNEAGGRVDYANFLKKWNRALALAGLRQRSPHSLRHTWASIQIAAGEDPAWVSRHLGHANVGITLALYTHFVEGQKRQRTSPLDRADATGAQLAGGKEGGVD